MSSVILSVIYHQSILSDLISFGQARSFSERNTGDGRHSLCPGVMAALHFNIFHHTYTILKVIGPAMVHFLRDGAITKNICAVIILLGLYLQHAFHHLRILQGLEQISGEIIM